MNKKGFTLVELLATMAILAIISVIAVPNVIKIMSDNKKEKVINDAVSVIALAKYEVAGDSDLRGSLDATGTVMNLETLDTMNDITLDPDGVAYDKNASYVKISNNNGVIEYCVFLKSANWQIENNGSCLTENLLLGDNAKRFVNNVES